VPCDAPDHTLNCDSTITNFTIDKVHTHYTLNTTTGTLTTPSIHAAHPTSGPPPPATHLAFGVQPSNTQVGATITPAVTVTALDASGNTVLSFTGAVLIAIDNNPVGGTLTGNAPVNDVKGVATFTNMKIDKE